MEKLSMCRVCMGKTIRLNSIVDTHLQEIYESLAMVPFETKDIRPLLVCYICRARLQNCYELRRSCLRSEELFAQMMTRDELKPLEIQQTVHRKLVEEHNVVQISIGDVPHMNDSEQIDAMMFVNVKIENDSDSEDIIEDAPEGNSVYEQPGAEDSVYNPLITVKQEQSGDEIICEVSPMYSEQAVQTSSDLKQHQLVQDNFKEVNKVTAADKTESVSCENSTNSNINVATEPYQYDVCGKKNITKNNSISKQGSHSGEKPFACNLCTKKFSRKGNLKAHILAHSGKGLLQCSMCEKQFSQKCDLNKHLRAHTGEKPYQCGVCMKPFIDKTHLTIHMRTHTGEKPFFCVVCSKTFSEKGHLTTHMRLHTGEKPYSCDICKRQFSQNGTLTEHMRTHTGEKPYNCDICKKGFKQSSNLTSHMRTHTGEKPYYCNICSSQFALRSSLNKHMVVHNSDKPHECDICMKKFSTQKTLKYHKRYVHA